MREEDKGIILSAVECGASFTDAAAAAGIARSTFYEKRKEDPEFEADLARSKSVFKVSMLALINAAAPKTWQAAAWLLERRYPKQFGRTTVETKHSGTVTSKIIVEGSFEPASTEDKE